MDMIDIASIFFAVGGILILIIGSARVLFFSKPAPDGQRFEVDEWEQLEQLEQLEKLRKWEEFFYDPYHDPAALEFDDPNL